MKNNLKLITAITALSILMFSCRKEIFIESGAGLADWTTNSHSNNVDPNYDVVFNQSKVHRIDIVFTSSDWNDMQDDLDDVTGGSGGGPGGGGPGGGFSDQTPQYFECEFYYNNIEWYNVGVRYKGNSSLKANSEKLPLRFVFDKFEDTYPEINNQRFYGFKELAMSSNYNDKSLMREKSASDLFRHFGVPSVQTAFYEIYIDNGNGPEYYGLYTMDEIVFDSFLKNYFGSETGNCYKPDGDGAKFSTSGFDLDDFELKTNTTSTDKSDIQEMYDILHSSNRTSNTSQWKNDLEKVFDVDGFLKYLAANNTIQNWDTYAKMTHNYYLYHDPADGLIKWIVWDNNEAFTSGSGQKQPISLTMSEVGTDWPLINFIIANADYKLTYENYLRSFITTSFTTSRMNTIYSDQQTLLYNSANSERSGFTYLTGINSFTSAVSTLKSHCSSRVSAVNSYLP